MREDADARLALPRGLPVPGDLKEKRVPEGNSLIGYQDFGQPCAQVWSQVYSEKAGGKRGDREGDADYDCDADLNRHHDQVIQQGGDKARAYPRKLIGDGDVLGGSQ